MASFSKSLNKLPVGARVGLLAGLLGLVFGVYYMMFHGPILDQLKSARAKHTRLTRELEEAKAAERAYQKDLAELAEREKRQNDFNRALPAHTEYPAFLSAVQSAANLAGVGLAAWTPRQEVREEFYARVPMKVELGGRFHQIARFFHNVGQLDRIINMEDISITDPRQSGDEVMLRAEVLATAFHALEAEPADGQTPRTGRRRRR